MSKSVKLSCTLTVENPDGGICEGHIGFFTYDDEVGDVIGITAAQVSGRTGNIMFEDIIVARPSDNRYPSPDKSNPRPADTMLAPVFIGNVEIEEGRPEIAGQDEDGAGIVRDLPDVLGELVLVHTGPEKKTRKAYVRSTEGQFRMPCPWTAEMTLFNCAIELATLGDGPVTKEGDAGALVTTMSGAPIGLIVCGFPDVSFAAPFATKSSLQSCRLLTQAQIKKFNHNVRVGDELESEIPFVEALTQNLPNPSKLSEFKEVVEHGDEEAAPSKEQCEIANQAYLA